MAENKMGAYVRKDNDREWIEDKKLELRLGPPDGDFDWNKKEGSFNGYNFSNNPIPGNKKGFGSTIKDHVFSAPWSSSSNGGGVKNSSLKQQEALMLHHLQQPSSSLKESSKHCTSSVNLQAFSPPAAAAVAANTAVSHANSGQKRIAPPPVVGWPPVRSFRRNIASSSNLNPNHVASGAGAVAHNKICSNEKVIENNEKGLFVKINMDGVPIGRKVDLKVYDSYQKLSFAVDDLFRGLLAAQNGELWAACGTGTGTGSKIKEEEKVISGVLDGSGEYALVYEDNEGDRMLVGDVPWQMFISTVKRLRVLKKAEISSLCKKKEVVS